MTNISSLRLPEQFSYEYFIENRYKISQNKHYESLCNNGFIKLYTPNARRIYWHVQNEFGHITPDWKFHISVKHQQLPKAWNLIAGLFLIMKCRNELKTYYLKECNQPQPGREITVYILQYVDLYRKSCFANDFSLSRADQHSQEFWYEFVKNVETILESQEIQPNGLASGDLKIGKYVSLRNEAFVLNQNGQHVYPSNDFGWNPHNMQIPLNLKKLNDYLNSSDQKEDVKLNKNRVISFVIPAAIAILAYVSMKNNKIQL